MKGLMIFADGFEDVEGIATVDILKRAQIKLTCVTLKNKKEVTTSAQNHLVFEQSLADVDYKTFDFLILPGGPAVFNELDKSKKVDEVVNYFCTNQKLVCAICAAPLLIGKHGYFENLDYTCFPGCNEKIYLGNKVDDGVVHSKNFITAKSMYYACDFALEIVSTIKGNDKAISVAKQIKGME
ncbi:MAG: DJ-1/PfpI family protein [Erysipelotrichaceae bacterium]|nr:DJ-1/PfpI family protein [Erysipelotrichaceae bacterium]